MLTCGTRTCRTGEALDPDAAPLAVTVFPAQDGSLPGPRVGASTPAMSSILSVCCRTSHARRDHLGCDAGPPAPVVSSDCRSEHEVQKLLKSKMLLRRPYVLSASQWCTVHAAAHSAEP